MLGVRYLVAVMFAALGLASAAWADPRPFRLVGNQIVLPVKVEGRETLALLDTGATTTSIDAGFAGMLGLSMARLGLTYGAAGKHIPYKRTAPIAIDLGDGIAVRRSVAVHPSTQAIAAKEAQILIGMDVLADEVVTLDFEHMTIDFAPSRSFRAPQEPPLKLKGLWERRSLRVTVGGKEGDFLLDTAASGALHLSEAFEPATPGQLSSRTLVSGIDGVFAQRVSSHDVSIAGILFEHVPATIATLGPLASGYDGVDGVIGIDLMRRFNLVIDYGRNRLWMTPNTDLAAPFRRNRIGVIVDGKAGRGTIRFIAPHSPAERAGFKVGETISVFEDKAGGVIEDLMSLGDGDAVTAVMSDGLTRRVTALTYY